MSEIKIKLSRFEKYFTSSEYQMAIKLEENKYKQIEVLRSEYYKLTEEEQLKQNDNIIKERNRIRKEIKDNSQDIMKDEYQKLREEATFLLYANDIQYEEYKKLLKHYDTGFIPVVKKKGLFNL